MINTTTISQHTGQYIRFEGMGCINGLKQPKTKARCYKIIAAEPDRLTLQGYGRRVKSVLPSCNFNQGYEIITQVEFKSLPAY